MAIYRRRARRFRGRRPRMARRPLRAMRSARIRKRINKYNVHSFVRWTDAPEGGRTLSCNFGPGGENFRGYIFSLNDVVNPGEFTSLYDSYKITGVKVYFDYSPDFGAATSTDTNLASGMYMPKLWLKRDYDDATTPLSIGEFLQSNQTTCIRFTPDRTTRSIFIRPSVRNEITSGTTNMWRPWINCGDSSVEHYGLKLCAQGLPLNNLGTITIRCKYYLKFKNVR